MTRKRWIQQKNGDLVEVGQDFELESRSTAAIWGEIPEYVSPVTGKVISGRVQRREDMASAGARPWEGKDQEVKEAKRRQAYIDQAADQRLEAAARKAWHSLNPDKRKHLR
jgi:hypothetical protein